MANLRQLDLSANNLTGPLPAEWRRLDHLERLRLAGNHLTELRPQEDRAALVALYYATDGTHWDDGTGWLSDAPLSGWYGVSTDARGRVTELALSGNSLAGALPAELGNLGHLEELDLSENRLTGALPAECGHLSKLEQLDLARNNLTGPLPQSLTRLKALELFYFDDTKLCAPRDRAFQEWLGGMGDVSGANC